MKILPSHFLKLGLRILNQKFRRFKVEIIYTAITNNKMNAQERFTDDLTRKLYPANYLPTFVDPDAFYEYIKCVINQSIFTTASDFNNKHFALDSRAKFALIALTLQTSTGPDMQSGNIIELPCSVTEYLNNINKKN
jgi:hypothetical protein